MMKKIDRFNVGDKAEFKHAITEQDVRKFIELTGDDNPLHTNHDFAKKTPLKRTVVHGMLSASFISTIIGKYIPGKGALWVSQNLNFLLPVRVGDELTIHAEILKKQTRHNMLTLKTEIRNQHKQVVVSGEGLVKVLDIEEAEPEVPAETDKVVFVANGENRSRVLELGKPAIERPAKIEKKVVLITGASRGIGAATAILLAKRGYCVAINYRLDRAGAEEVMKQIRKNGGRGMICQADVADFDAVKNMASEIIGKFGTVTALVNNASGKIVPQDFQSLEWRDIQSHLDTQVKGAFNCIAAVTDEFLKNKSGAVVNVGSIYSNGAPPQKLVSYILAKSALRSFTKSLAVEFGPKGIRFNMVAPGMTDTDLISDVPEKVRLMTTMQTPLRKIAKPDDIAHAIAFLLSDEAQHITGEVLRVCGGSLMI